MRSLFSLVVAGALCATTPVSGRQGSGAAADAESYLTWTADQARRIGQSARVNGRVGGVFDFRMLNTDRSYNYKLRATWLTPEVIRATARLAQIGERLSNQQAAALVAQAEAVGDTVILVEIDPREGSGVIPLDWSSFLGPKGAEPGAPSIVKGRIVPEGRDVRALAGVFRRDYNYEVFWLAFPLIHESGSRIVDRDVAEAELAVRIHSKEGRVTWPVPESIRNHRRP